MKSDHTVSIVELPAADRYPKKRVLPLVMALPLCLLAAQPALSGDQNAPMTNYYKPATPSKIPHAPPPVQNANYRPGTISGMVWWDTTKVQRSLSSMHPEGGSLGLSTSSCTGINVSAGEQSTPVGNIRYLNYSQTGTMAKCAFEIDQVPVGVNLTVSDRVEQSTFKTPVAASGASPYFKIPGGACNGAISPSMPNAGIATCGNRASNVNLELVSISSVPQPK